MSIDQTEQTLSKLFAPHVESFNYFLSEGLENAIADMDPVYATFPNQKLVPMWIEKVEWSPPHRKVKEDLLKPRDCRLSGVTYGAECTATIGFRVENGEIQHVTKSMGRIPIMVRSDLCNLQRELSGQKGRPLNSNQRRNALAYNGEDSNEMGGFFVVNGNEKLIRLLIVQRRNFPLAFVRDAYEQTAPIFTKYAISIRCCRNDQSSQTMSLHFLRNSDMILRIAINRKSYFIPAVVLLKALRPTNDREIFEAMVLGHEEDTMVTEHVMAMLRANLTSQKGKDMPSTVDEAIAAIGDSLGADLPSVPGDNALTKGRRILQKYILVHLDRDDDKWEYLILMMRKLNMLVMKKINPDNAESVCFQEILLPGHLYTMLMKEKMQEWLESVKAIIERDAPRAGKKPRYDVTDYAGFLSDAMNKTKPVAKKMEYFLATGNINSKSGLDLRQKSGFSIVAERLNFLRYISHFRSVHRGQFYTEMRTSAVRKLLPDSWGFVCPVHTPDGAPCGLLNHLGNTCEVTMKPFTNWRGLRSLLAQVGMLTMDRRTVFTSDHIPVILDGRIIGMILDHTGPRYATLLRRLKTEGQAAVPNELGNIDVSECIPHDLEIAYVPLESTARMVPGLWLFSHPARMSRPVHNKQSNCVEMIGTYEQAFMTIECPTFPVHSDPNAPKLAKPKTVSRPEKMSHRELDPMNMFSVVATMTPFSDFNQSPRNMYQCQMGKQTMGTPLHNYEPRADNKLFRILTPQSPIVQTKGQYKFQLDQYAHGANAVIAVLSYTGYDMEDAMVINKSAYERGFGHGLVYKSEMIDISDRGNKKEGKLCYFHNLKEDGSLFCDKLDSDGLPSPGDKIKEGEPWYCYYDESEKTHRVVRYKAYEMAMIDQIVCVGIESYEKEPLGAFQKVIIKWRINRNPARGDKFASRHGQKGVMSQLYPQINMPFTGEGLTPDVIINPNAFPSRMTIGMLIEIMAAKAGAIHGMRQDATPFSFDESYGPHKHFGEQLVKAGYNYYGNEMLYSGVTGEPFWAEVFFGVCYYQRLRHMVGDKFQVRSEGRTVQTTRQPIKGRKKGGGIRFGEMERDSILAHGVMTILKDRLLLSSDADVAFCCSKCGNMLTVWPLPPPRHTRSSAGQNSDDSVHFEDADVDPLATNAERELQARRALMRLPPDFRCHSCHDSKREDIKVIRIPYVLRLLVVELAALGVHTTFKIDDGTIALSGFPRKREKLQSN